MSELKDRLFYSPKNGYDRVDEATVRRIFSCGEQYKTFLDRSRTERDASAYTVELAENAGFRPYTRGMKLQPGDKIYTVNRAKSVILAVIGKESLKKGVNIIASHVDVPRLDLKPLPLYEDRKELCYLKTHYYGGVKKYQWTTIPLALKGVVALKDGSVVDIEIGTKPEDPIFCITDLLPHLAKDQRAKTLGDGITGEGLNVLVSSIPSQEEKEGSDRTKLAVLSYLNEQYGIVEEDFTSAELSIVPATPARDVGFDRSLVGGYGHDDRVCAFGSVFSLLNLGTPTQTAVCILADKEEIGSVGSTGMQSEFFDNFIESLCESEGGVTTRECFHCSACLSADVSAAFDPLYAEAYDAKNSAYANYGMSLVKYVGSGGKSGSNDAHAEYMGRLRQVFDEAGVIWSTCELGKVDQGGGGTVAGFMGRRNIETVDIGVPVLSMHSPFEVISKFDLYMFTKACAAFYAASNLSGNAAE